MATVNLLPWRERQRYQQQRQFMRSLLLVALLTLAVLWLWHWQISQQIDHQQQRNAFLQQHLAELEQRYQKQQQQLQQLAVLTQQKRQLEAAQRNPEVFVQLLETLARAVPQDVYLTALNQSGERIEIAGRVDQPASLTPLLRNLSASSLISDATLVTLETDHAQTSAADSQFRLEVRSIDLAEESAG
ncbi:PilN domain-containing protein [Saccharospirillum sp. HFRX-1]|uniref:PilN domain-containing protein n=1 Tax=unclassified Saccharospirillum TaxID=2633430 RepID=UPI00371E5094